MNFNIDVLQIRLNKEVNMEVSDNQLFLKWNELKCMAEEMEADIVKCSRGVNAAGVRVRKSLRLLKTRAQELVKLTLDHEKAKKED
jgi:hypothetical protein